MPSPTSTLMQSSNWSSAIFDETFPITYIIVGIGLGSLIIVFLIGLIIGALEKFKDYMLGRVQGRHTVHNFLGKTEYIVPFHEDTEVTRRGTVVDRWRH